MPKHVGVTATSFFDDFLESPPGQSKQTAMSCKEECELYLQSPTIPMETNVLEWWKANQDRFSHMAKMARQYLGMPVSSATVERLFSSAGLAFSDLQQSMEPQTLEAILWAKFKCKR